MHKIELPIGFFDASFEQIQAYCGNFNCSVVKPKRGAASYTITSNDPLNFFWLGANINLKSQSSLTITPAEKYLGK